AVAARGDGEDRDKGSRGGDDAKPGGGAERGPAGGAPPQSRAGRETGHGKENAEDRRDRREEQSPAPPIGNAKERLHAAARDVDALERGQRRLGGAEQAPLAIAGQRVPQSRGGREREQLGALQLLDEPGNQLEVELAVVENVGGRDVLNRGAPVHLVPQEALGLREHQEALGLRVLEDEAAL